MHCFGDYGPWRAGWDEGSPIATLREDDEIDDDYEPPWAVHRYRYHKEAPLGPVYYAEPYWVDLLAMHDLAVLLRRDWIVRVSAEYAAHFPGRTVQVELIPPGKARR